MPSQMRAVISRMCCPRTASASRQTSPKHPPSPTVCHSHPTQTHAARLLLERRTNATADRTRATMPPSMRSTYTLRPSGTALSNLRARTTTRLTTRTTMS
ncbi:hypothetical protein IG631_15553 [Alternaria alternata]|nr:hypothetical protein IG631_15553 [Alternaria alternata]